MKWGGFGPSFLPMKYRLTKHSTMGPEGAIIEADDNLAAQLRVNDLIEPVSEKKISESGVSEQKVIGPEIVKVTGPEVKKRGRPAKNASDTAD